MIGTRSKRGKSLNKVDEIAFKAWAETGSLDNARLYFEKQKILHDSGKQYSVAGIRFCAMRYMIKNYDIALAFLTDEYKKRGIIPNPESIEITLVNYAVEVLKYKNEVIKWAEEHELLDKYRSIIDERTQHAPLETKRARIIRQIQQ